MQGFDNGRGLGLPRHLQVQQPKRARTTINATPTHTPPPANNIWPKQAPDNPSFMKPVLRVWARSILHATTCILLPEFPGFWYRRSCRISIINSSLGYQLGRPLCRGRLSSRLHPSTRSVGLGSRAWTPPNCMSRGPNSLQED